MALPKVSLTQKIFIGLAIGVLVGWLWPDWGQMMRPLSMLFLNLIKSIIAPLGTLQQQCGVQVVPAQFQWAFDQFMG